MNNCPECENCVPKTRIEKFRSMSDGELAIWFAKTQLGWTKNICEEFGMKFDYTEDDVLEVARENLAWFLEPMGGELNEKDV